MKKIMKNNSANFLAGSIIFFIVAGWIFIGWPKIWQDPQIPPKIQEVYAIQTGLPNGDISTGSWTDEGTVDNDGFLYTSIDEASADGDDSYIVSFGTTATAEVGLPVFQDPGVDTGHIIHVWIRSIGSGGVERMRVALFQGTTEIETSGNLQNRSTTYAEQVFTIAEANAANITDYADLRIRIISRNLGGSEEMRVTKVEFEISDAVGIPPATWREAEDTLTFGVIKETNIRLRIEAANTGATATDYDYFLESALKIGAVCGDDEVFTAVPVTAATEHFEMTTSNFFADSDPTTAQFANTEGHIFTPGRIVESPSNSSGLITLSAGNYTEIEFVFRATLNATDGESYCFRVTNNGTALDEYSVYPELQIIP
ncbi:hypothetical protein IH779_01605 [Patescibacteria group bacterium]|nr:hypothetical protein [Patescibacteria group bacterium]